MFAGESTPARISAAFAGGSGGAAMTICAASTSASIASLSTPSGGLQALWHQHHYHYTASPVRRWRVRHPRRVRVCRIRLIVVTCYDTIQLAVPRLRPLFTFPIEPELAKALKLVKARDGISEAEQIRRGIRLWLKSKRVRVGKPLPR